MADGVAEARLLMPHPEAGTGYDQHSHDNADHDGPLLARLLGSRRSLGLLYRGDLGGLLFFGHTPSFQLGISRRGCASLVRSEQICPPQLIRTSRNEDARLATRTASSTLGVSLHRS